MKEIPGQGPGTIGTLTRSKRSKLGSWHSKPTNWPFSARHNRLNAERRRLISRYTDASRSYGKSESGLGLAGRRRKAERPARIRGMRRRRSLNDWRGGGGGRDHAGQGAAK